MTDQNRDKKRAHGRTFAENKAIREKQVRGEVEMIPANNAGNFQDDYFKKVFEGYQIPEHERDCYHVALEARSFNPSTGEKLSKPRVQTYSRMTYTNMRDQKPYSGFHGFSVHVLHDPTRTTVAPKKAVAPAPVPAPEQDDTKDEVNARDEQFGVIANKLKYQNGVTAELLPELKDAKEFYEFVTGLAPAKSWNKAKTYLEIQKHFDNN